MKPRTGGEARSATRGPGRSVAGLGVLAGAALAAVCCVGLLGLLGALALLGPTRGPSASPRVGTAVGDVAPDFRVADIDGATITRETLRGEPALLWFTTSYCVPCPEGAARLRQVMARTATQDRVRVIMVFIDPGEPVEALAWWRDRFGRPEWSYAPAPHEMVTDFAIQYLDSKVLLDRDGVIRASDFLQLDEDAWARHLEAVTAG